MLSGRVFRSSLRTRYVFGINRSRRFFCSYVDEGKINAYSILLIQLLSSIYFFISF